MNSNAYLGYFCTYFPYPLAEAAGFATTRIFPSPGTSLPPLLPASCCAPARSYLQQALHGTGEFSRLAAVGFAHTCDTMQSLSGIWDMAELKLPAVHCVPPVNLAASTALSYLVKELTTLYEKLKVLAPHPSQRPLPAILELFARLLRAAAVIARGESYLAPTQLYRLYHRIQTLPLEAAVTAAEEAAKEIPAPLTASATGSAASKTLLLAGPVLENDSLHAMLEELGAVIAADETCSGGFALRGTLGSDYSSDPLTALAAYYLNRPHCPCRYRQPTGRINYLLDRARNAGVQGALIIIRKFCDPHAWDSVDLGRAFQAAGIPALILEVESLPPGEREKTRLQAFLENL